MGKRKDLQALTDLAQQFGVPLVEQVRTWKSPDPAVKLRRQVNRADRRRTRWAYTAAGCSGIAVILALTGGAATAFAVFVVLAVLSAVTSVRAYGRLRVLRREQAALPAVAPARAALPGKSSRAYEPMRRLAGAEASLAELLGQLEHDSKHGAVPAESVAAARATGAEAAAALRAVAARMATLETAVQHTSGANRAELAASVEDLRGQLEAGIDGYGELIAAAGRVVAAGTPAPTHRAVLTEATDHLAGLAAALRELSAS
ncbi:phage shock envelope stress response protein PspM [Labedaea rhizosphaerae]|uniref:Uncharacterized protein n=1 Tax=Labedaea rhizosphaerae TaxID=598644 RepID=A0A4V3CZA1_LABRH|nr:hypothetical protein [Labedaea rhizosphaerae]TDP97248.1 hypothetical protein EV186_103211 [Labedaea rhizosphaerae]